MDLTAAIRAEYQRHRRLVELAIAQVQDADLSRRPCPGGNSIAITMVHLAGNLRSRFTDFLTSDGENRGGIATASSTSRGSAAPGCSKPGPAPGRSSARLSRPSTTQVPEYSSAR